MSATSRVDIVDTAYTEIASGSGTVQVFVHGGSAGEVDFIVATSLPAADAPGHLPLNGRQAWPFPNLGLSDKVYAKSRQGPRVIGVYKS